MHNSAKLSFSIIIPTYNSGKTLYNTIESILKQTFNGFEIVIVDGISGDDTLKIASAFNDDRIKIFSEKDTGVYDAMNKGILHCNGEWIYFLGSDDVLLNSEVLEKIKNEIQLNSDTDFIYGDVVFKSSNQVYYGESSLYRLLNEGNISHQAIFYKKSIFQKVGLFNLKYKVYADWEFNIRCFFDERTIKRYIDIKIALFNDLDGISANNRTENDPEFMLLLPAYYKHINPGLILNKSVYYRFGSIVLAPFRFLKWLKNK